MKPICVDLDGTLLLTDSLAESLILLLRQNPFYLFLALIWLLQGRAYFKAAVASRTHLNPEQLIYNQNILTWLKVKKSLGHDLYLVTGANEKIAITIANYLGIFSGVLASKDINLVAKHKAKACNKQFGKYNYIYLGNSKNDLPVWQDADSVVCVTDSRRLENQCRQLGHKVEYIRQPKPTLKEFLKAVRAHQYAKNILLFIPLFLNEQLFNQELWYSAPLAFIAFCATCSITYLINDFYDLNADRQHKTKNKRGFASGRVPLIYGFYLIIAFAIIAILAQIILSNLYFTLALGIYFILSLAYSQWLKEIAIMDVLSLTVLYTLRILAGMMLIADPISNWFLTFSICFFLSLSFLKRYIELQALPIGAHIPRRGYQQSHILFVLVNGLALACLSVVIFVLYIASNKASAIYANVNILYLVAFVLFFWIQRIWLLAIDKKVNEDPVIFAIKDKISYITGILCVGLLTIAHIGF